MVLWFDKHYSLKLDNNQVSTSPRISKPSAMAGSLRENPDVAAPAKSRNKTSSWRRGAPRQRQVDLADLFPHRRAELRNEKWDQISPTTDVKRLAQLADAATIVANKAGQTGVVNAVAEYRKLYAENKALIG